MNISQAEWIVFLEMVLLILKSDGETAETKQALNEWVSRNKVIPDEEAVGFSQILQVDPFNLALVNVELAISNVRKIFGVNPKNN
jgi:hypothetical protein